MSYLPPELWLVILDYLELADLLIAGRVCRAWYKWAFDLRWGARPVRLETVLLLLELPKPSIVWGERKRFIIPSSYSPSKDILDRFFDIIAKVTAVIIDVVINTPTVQLLERLAASSPSEILFPALRSLEYSDGRRPDYGLVNQLITSSQLKKMVFTTRSGGIFEIDGRPQIFHAFEHHQGLEEVHARGFKFEPDVYPGVPWPLKLRCLHYRAAWTWKSWKELIERCTELRYVNIGCFCREDWRVLGTSAQENTQQTIIARNLRVLDVYDGHKARIILSILKKTEMPELRELSIRLGKNASRDDTMNRLGEALRLFADRSYHLEKLTVETSRPIEIDSLRKFHHMHTLHITNQASEAWPRDEDIEILARSMPRLRFLSAVAQDARATTLSLELLATHCKQLRSLAIGIDATNFQHSNAITPFSQMLTSMTFTPLRIPTSTAELFAYNLSGRMPGVDKFQGSVIGVDENGRTFWWIWGLTMINRIVGER